MRAGAYGLSLLSNQLDVQVLRTLGQSSLPFVELCREVGVPPQTTMRTRLKTMTELGILERRQANQPLRSVAFELTRSGRDLLDVAEVVEAWLALAPGDPQSLGSAAAKRSLKALSEAWSACIVRAVAARPLSLTELSKLISALNYPSLERRLAALRFAGLVEPRPGSTKGTPHAATSWLKRAVAPLVAAARWEQRHIPLIAAPLTRIDIETTFLLAAPLLRLAPELKGTCRLAVEVGRGGDEGGRNLAGVLVGVDEGRVVRCASQLRGEAGAWASGSASAWLDAALDREPGRLETGGDVRLAAGLLDGLNVILAGAKTTV